MLLIIYWRVQENELKASQFQENFSSNKHFFLIWLSSSQHQNHNLRNRCFTLYFTQNYDLYFVTITLNTKKIFLL